jgi:hypothetical protein
LGYQVLPQPLQLVKPPKSYQKGQFTIRKVETIRQPATIDEASDVESMASLTSEEDVNSPVASTSASHIERTSQRQLSRIISNSRERGTTVTKRKILNFTKAIIKTEPESPTKIIRVDYPKPRSQRPKPGPTKKPSQQKDGTDVMVKLRPDCDVMIPRSQLLSAFSRKPAVYVSKLAGIIFGEKVLRQSVIGKEIDDVIKNLDQERLNAMTSECSGKLRARSRCLCMVQRTCKVTNAPFFIPAHVIELYKKSNPNISLTHNQIINSLRGHLTSMKLQNKKQMLGSC